MTIIVKNKISEIPAVARTVEDFCSRYELEVKVKQHVQLALEELLTNIISYAFEDEAEHEIKINLRIEPRLLTMTLEDHGKEWDMGSVPSYDVRAPLENRPVGGLGIHLVKNVMDRVVYKRVGGTNRTTIHKTIG